VNLTRRYFAAHGVTDYRIVESLGATEGAPAAGQAELIVDITTTGATLKANALKVLDDGIMLKSQANLVASLKADWSPRARAAARAVLSRIAAEEEARLTREVRARVASAPADFVAQAQARFASRAPFGDPVEGRVTLHCPVASVAEVADWLIGMGAERVSVGALAYVFCARNALYERLERRIG
jgi:ATP phosphoribosyltransferase